ncbi:MAG: GDP-mannose 4,6-dehydratase [Pseudomonadota bacterium]
MYKANVGHGLRAFCLKQSDPYATLNPAASIHICRGPHHVSTPSFWRDRTVLVAGATGFLGGWVVRKLVDYGANVIAIVRTARPESQFFMKNLQHRVRVKFGDIADAAFVAKVFEEHPDISVFFHCAYGADVNRVLKEPLECFQSAAVSTWNILDLCRRKYPTCACIISSTDKAYGNQALPYRESSPLDPRHPYEIAKACQDLSAQSYGKIFGLPTAITRCGNYYGGYDFNLTRLIPGVMKDLVEGRQPVLRSNGRFTRDFLYIEDAAEVQLFLAERIHGDPSLYGEAFNFSYGLEIEVIDIVRRLSALFGDPVEPIVNDSVRVEIPHMRLCSDKAADRLGWKPRYSFDQGLQRTVAWYSQHFKKALLAA